MSVISVEAQAWLEDELAKNNVDPDEARAAIKRLSTEVETRYAEMTSDE